MNQPESRRKFVKKLAIGGTTLLGAQLIKPAFAAFSDNSSLDLYSLSRQLVGNWGEALLNLQVTDKSRVADYGGIVCPSRKKVHGRIGDTIYPFLYLAQQTNDQRYLDSSLLLYQWMENNVSQADGSWLNEPVKGSWKGTTVFSVIALAEALKNYSGLMPNDFKKSLETRLLKAGDFIYDNFSIDYGNVNYPISASYALSLLGHLLDIPKFILRGREFSRTCLTKITKEGFIFGEGDFLASKKACYAVDLGYNVEESLPALVLYGLLNKDEEVLGPVTESLQTHMEFMLPDGAWDNSWGTRNYKWTYWGSRTTDGSQPAYALLADRDERFYQVALKNTQLLQKCTKDGILTGGPHYVSHGIQPSVHHTFCHIKALTTILDHRPERFSHSNFKTAKLPRENAYGFRFFESIQTALISVGVFRGTITTYDKEYKKTKDGHASGGALTMLWHERVGPLLCASMNRYQLIEADNMQVDSDPYSMPLTPRVELRLEDSVFMNISDLSAVLSRDEKNGEISVQTVSHLVNENQESPEKGPVRCVWTYVFSPQKVRVSVQIDDRYYPGQPKLILPLVSSSQERVAVQKHTIEVYKSGGIVRVASDSEISQMPTSSGRIFNYVPGFEAIPFQLAGNNITLSIEINQSK